MFESFKDAWKQAVDNFWHELEADDSGGDARVRTAYREVAAARKRLGRLEGDIDDCRRARDHEREQARVCARRAAMARQIHDEETARIASEYLTRHEERAAVLDRKLEALRAEHSLCRRDLAEMERVLLTLAPDPAVPELDDINRHPREDEFRDLETAARERAAAERLDELRRRHEG
jgi:chromosome segregation ATPase